MKSKLLSDEKYEELLRSRSKPLTKNQIAQLRQIDRAGVSLNHFKAQLSDELREETFAILRRKQMEILTNERNEPWERLLNSLPDEVTNKINLF